jgi:hypothetical protein
VTFSVPFVAIYLSLCATIFGEYAIEEHRSRCELFSLALATKLSDTFNSVPSLDFEDRLYNSPGFVQDFMAANVRQFTIVSTFVKVFVIMLNYYCS